MTMSSRIPGGPAGSLPPGPAAAGRRGQTPPRGFDEAYRNIADTSSDSAPPAGAARTVEVGASQQPAKGGHWSLGLSRHDTTGAGEPSSGSAGEPTDTAEGGKTSSLATEHEPARAAGRNAAKENCNGTPEEGKDAASDGRDREKDGDKSSDGGKVVALAITTQPAIDIEKRSAAKTGANGAAAAGQGRTGEIRATGGGDDETVSGETAKARDAAGGTPARAAKPRDGAVAAKVLPDPADRPSALSGLNARLAAAGAGTNPSRVDRAEATRDGKASSAERDTFQLLKPAAVAMSAAGQKPTGNKTVVSKAAPEAGGLADTERPTVLRTRQSGHTQDRGGDQKSGHPGNRSAEGRSLKPAGPAAGIASASAPGATAGASQGANVATVANAIASRPDWTQALSTTATGAPGGLSPGAGAKAMTIQLNPANLGTVTATLTVSGDRLVIDLQVQTAEAYRQLSTGNDGILDKLKGHGYAVEAITVQHVVADRPAATQVQQQQHPGFAASHGGAGGMPRGGEQMAGQGQGHRSGGQQPFLDDPAVPGGDPSGAAGTGGGRTDGVYV